MEDIPNSIRNTMGIVADVALLKKQGKDVIRIIVKISPMTKAISQTQVRFSRTIRRYTRTGFSAQYDIRTD